MAAPATSTLARAAVLPTLVVALLLAACGSTAPSAAGRSAESPVSGTVTVFAAASLQEAFSELADSFQARYAGTRVRVSFGASSSLAQSILRGAPADVFAAASPTTMESVSAEGMATDVTLFARNVLEIAVPPDNPANVTALADLAKPEVTVALCQPQVPCGAATAAVLEKAGIAVRPVTLEIDVKSTLAKVQLGEVDAGVVYVTDVLAAAGRVRGVPIPEELNVATAYPIAPLADAPNAPGAEAFVAHVLSAEGRRALEDAGFRRP